MLESSPSHTVTLTPNGNPVSLDDGFDFAGLENQTIGIFIAFANLTEFVQSLDIMENVKSMINIDEGIVSATD